MGRAGTAHVIYHPDTPLTTLYPKALADAKAAALDDVFGHCQGHGHTAGGEEYTEAQEEGAGWHTGATTVDSHNAMEGAIGGEDGILVGGGWQNPEEKGAPALQ